MSIIGFSFFLAPPVAFSVETVDSSFRLGGAVAMGSDGKMVRVDDGIIAASPPAVKVNRKYVREIRRALE